MDVLSLNADQRLAATASAIGRDPQSWRGWHCLYLAAGTEDTDIVRDCIVWTRAVTESYLKGIEGRIYACGGGDIHIICRDAGRDLLEQAAAHIRDYINADNKIKIASFIYDLGSDGVAYASSVLAKNGNILTPPEPVHQGACGLELGKILNAFPSDPQYLSKSGQIKAMLVEDDPVTRWMARHALKEECRLATAPTANAAFNLYASWQPDIIFLDINLPDQNGLAVLEWIMRNDPGARVIMFSGAHNIDSIAGALEKGASGFVAKPFFKESLLHYVRNLAA